jgi:hypothetical protein
VADSLGAFATANQFFGGKSEGKFEVEESVGEPVVGQNKDFISRGQERYD